MNFLTRPGQALLTVILFNPLSACVYCKCTYILVGVTVLFFEAILVCDLSIANSQYSCVLELCTVVIMITLVGVLRHMQPPENESTKNLVTL